MGMMLGTPTSMANIFVFINMALTGMGTDMENMDTDMEDMDTDMEDMVIDTVAIGIDMVNTATTLDGTFMWIYG
jgi:hypothetical protein